MLALVAASACWHGVPEIRYVVLRRVPPVGPEDCAGVVRMLRDTAGEFSDMPHDKCVAGGHGSQFWFCRFTFAEDLAQTYRYALLQVVELCSGVR